MHHHTTPPLEGKRMSEHIVNNTSAPEHMLQPDPLQQTAPEAGQQQEQQPEAFDPERHNEKLRKANQEAASLRARLKELEPLANKAREAEEASKSEVQRATERAQQLEQQLQQATLDRSRYALAAKYGIGEDHFRYIVGSNDEEREEAAVGIAQMIAAARGTTPPRTERPLEQLRPGATPTEQVNDDDAFYASLYPNPPARR